MKARIVPVSLLAHTLVIGKRRVGSGRPVLIIAEAGVNHNGKREVAKRLVDAAVDAGADAVKFQAFTAERLVSVHAPKAAYQRQYTDPQESQFAMLKRLELSDADHQALKAYCESRGVLYLCTPFDEASADMLEQLGVAAYKIPSGDITNWPLLSHIAKKRKPMIVSTGMSTMREVASALNVMRRAGARQVALLHCVSNYPARPDEANLRAIPAMAARCRVPIGYSDHTAGIAVALAAVTMGACIIEKHLTLDHDLPGPDHQASLEPQEFAALVKGIRSVEAALGHGRKEPMASERATAAVARKSLIAATAIAQGTRLTRELIAIKRPGTGLPPMMVEQVIGRRVARDIPADAILTPEMLR